MLIYRVLFIFIISLYLFIFTHSSSFATEGHDEIPFSKTVQSASELDYPPFSLVEKDGSAGGFSVDLLNAVGHAVGLEFSFYVAPWNQIKQQLIDGKIDVLPFVSYSKERDEVFDFTAPYLRLHGTIFVRKGEKSIHSEGDLKDKEVLVMRGDTAHEYAVKTKLSDRLILTDTFEEALRMLSSGKHDAVIIQQLAGIQLIKQLNISNLVDVSTVQDTNLKPMARPLKGFEQKFCIAVHEGDKALLSRLNEGLALVIANGVYDDLYHKWLGPILPAPPINIAVMAKYILLILLPIIGLLGILGIWYLKKEVVLKTKKLTAQIEISERAKRTLKEREAYLRTLIDTLPDLVWVKDLNGIYLSCNRRFEDFFGAEASEIIGKTDYDFLDKTWADFFRKKDNEAISKGEPSTNEETITFANDGHREILETVKTPIYETSGSLVGVLGIGRDITQRKEAEKEIWEAKERFQKVFNSQSDAIWVLNCEVPARVIEANESAVKIFGYPYDEMIGKTINIFHEDEIRQAEFAEKLFSAIKKDGALTGFEFKMKRKNGERFPSEHSVFELKNDAGKRTGWVSIVRDLTERKALEERLLQAQKLESIGNLAGGIAHDFNNILFPIIAFSEMLMDDLPPDGMEYENAQEILTAGKRGSELVNQILAFSRQNENIMIPVRVQQILKEVLKLIRSTIPANIEINHHLNSDCDVVMAEPKFTRLP